MIAATRGTSQTCVVELRRLSTGNDQIRSRRATWATASSTNLRSIPVLPIVIVRSSIANLLDRVRKQLSTNLRHTPPATKSP